MKKSTILCSAVLAALVFSPAQAALAAETTEELSAAADTTVSDTASSAETSADLSVEMPSEDIVHSIEETDNSASDVDYSESESDTETVIGSDELDTLETDFTDEEDDNRETESSSETKAESTTDAADQSVQTATSESESANDETFEIETETETADTFEAGSVDLSEYENQNVAQFIVRMYDKFLQRTPDKTGLQHWYEQLVSGNADSASIVEQFINSTEFLNRNLSTDAYLNILYQGILGRSADTNGKQYWVNTLKKGVSRNYIASNFVDSGEFKKLCANYNIESGEFPLNERRDQDINLTEWVNGFYSSTLNRSGDAVGLNYWTGRLLDQISAGADLVVGFMFSDEYTAKNTSDDSFINTLYQAVLSRSADATGLTHWKTYLNNGVSRKYITNEVVKSNEFAKSCSRRNIEVGSVELTENRDQNYKLTTYCSSAYKNIIGRTATVNELNALTGKCLTGSINHITFPAYFFSSTAYTDKNKSAEDFINDVYAFLLNRSPSASELSTHLSDLSTIYENDRAAFMNNIISSSEYIRNVKAVSIQLGTDNWFQLGSHLFYYNSEGQVQTGWLRRNGKRFYLDPAKKGMIQTGWAYIDGYKFYFYDDGVMATDLDDIIGEQSSYYIHVYKWGNYVIVFAKDGDNGYIIPCKVMICSAGVNTPTGTYWTPATYRWLTMEGGSKAQWCTQILGDYLFHSVPYEVLDNTTLYNESMYNKLGTTQSAGCIRLQAGYAKWIYDHCGAGTEVYIDPYNNYGPFDKPYFETLPSWHTWDPTDPTANYLCDAYGCTHNIVMP